MYLAVSKRSLNTFLFCKAGTSTKISLLAREIREHFFFPSRHLPFIIYKAMNILSFVLSYLHKYKKVKVANAMSRSLNLSSFIFLFMHKTSWKKLLQFCAHNRCFKPLSIQLQKKKKVFCSYCSLQLINKDLSFSNPFTVHKIKANVSLGWTLMEILQDLHK